MRPLSRLEFWLIVRLISTDAQMMVAYVILTSYGFGKDCANDSFDGLQPAST